MARRDLVVRLIGDSSDLERSFKNAQRQSGKLGGTFGGLGKTAALAGGAAGIGALAAGLKIGIGEFNEAQKVAAQTNAVIKSTGGVANVTARDVDKLSSALLKKSGVDDEQITTGQNMLLTFTKIRNEVGKGNDIFNQATKATLNLSVAMGKDMQSSAILVGKALNDPVKGVSALARAGVQLDASQKNLIKDLVEGRKAVDNLNSANVQMTSGQLDQALKLEKLKFSWEEIADQLNLKVNPAQQKTLEYWAQGGHAMEAQKILLKELETQFGGSAEAAGQTLGGQMKILRESFNNFAGEVVAKSIPALTSFATFIREDAFPIFRRFHEWFKDNINPILGRLKEIAVDAWTAIAKVLKDNEKEINRILGAVESIFRVLGETMLWLWQKVWLPYLDVMFTTVIPTALGFTITALDKVVTVAGHLRTAFAWFRDSAGKAISDMWTDIKKPLDLMLAAFDKVWDVIGKVVDAIKWLGEHGGGALGKLGGALGRLTGDAAGVPSVGAVAGLTGNDATISRALWDELGAARAMGLSLTSGYRPGAVTRHGTPSDHGTFPSKAIDVAGAPAAMAMFFRSLVGNPGVKQAFYDPLGSIFGGSLSGYREGGHSDHVHVATYDDAMRRARYLMPGFNLAYNGTGAPEPVGIAGRAGRTVIVNVYPQNMVSTEYDLTRQIRDTLAQIDRNNDGTGISQ